MRRRPPLAALIVLVVAGPAAADPPGAAQVEPRLRAAHAADPGEWVGVGVTLRRDDLPEAGSGRQARIAARRERVLAALPAGSFRPGRRYRSTPGLSGWARRAAVEALARHPEVRSVYLDARARLTLAQGSALIGASQAHAWGLTGAGVTVAVIDSGVDTDHPDLVDDLVAEQCYCESHPSPNRGCCDNNDDDQSGPGAAEDQDGHGTAVSGIVTSGGVVAPVGVAPGAGLVAIRVAGPNGALFSDIAAALDWVLLNRNAFADPIRVVNLSLGDGIEYNDPTQMPCTGSNTADMIEALHAAGVTVFVSSGNEGFDDGIAFPACSPGAFSVGGVYDASFSQVSWGGSHPCTDTNVSPDDFVCHTNSDEILDLLAPNFQTTTSGLAGGLESQFGGTSASSPYAAGQAALLLEADPTLTPDQVLASLVSTGTSVPHPSSGLSWPRSDVGEAAQPLLGECGNGALEPGEDCDDGGTAGGDCCAADCLFEAPGSPCDDGDLCSDGDGCDGGGLCQPGPALDCDDGDPCTAESCDPLLGCASDPIPGCGGPVPLLPPAAVVLLAVALLGAGGVLFRRGYPRR